VSIEPIAPEEDDLAHVNPSFPKVAAGFTLLGGALGFLNGVHILSAFVIFARGWPVAPYLMIGLGLALGALSPRVFTARLWAAIAAMGMGLVLALVAGAWLVFLVANGGFTLYALWTPAGALVTVALCGASLSPCARATRARARLVAQGLSIGL
jgi:hypothetical protein